MGIHTGVYLAAVENRADILVHNLRSSLAVGVDEIAARISIIVALGIAVAQRQLQNSLRGNLAAEFADAFLHGAVDGGIDGSNGFGVRLGNDDGTAVLGIAAVDGLGFPDVGVGKADETGNNLGVILLCHSS